MKTYTDDELRDYENAERLAESSLGGSDEESLLMSLARGAEYPSQCTSDETYDVPEAYYSVGDLYFEEEIPEMVCKKLDVVFSDLLNNGATFEQTLYDIEDVLLEYPEADLSSWMRLTSIVFQRYLHNQLNNRKQLSPNPPPPKRLLHRREFSVGIIETSDMLYNSDSDEEDENPVVLREAGPWLEVECTKGIYYFNNDDGTSQWSIVGTAFLPQEEDDEDLPMPNEMSETVDICRNNEIEEPLNTDADHNDSEGEELKEVADVGNSSQKKRWKKKNAEKVREMRKAQKKRRKERLRKEETLGVEHLKEEEVVAVVNDDAVQTTVDLLAAKIEELQLEMKFDRQPAVITSDADRMMRLM